MFQHEQCEGPPALRIPLPCLVLPSHTPTLPFPSLPPSRPYSLTPGQDLGMAWHAILCRVPCMRARLARSLLLPVFKTKHHKLFNPPTPTAFCGFTHCWWTYLFCCVGHYNMVVLMFPIQDRTRQVWQRAEPFWWHAHEKGVLCAGTCVGWPSPHLTPAFPTYLTTIFLCFQTCVIPGLAEPLLLSTPIVASSHLAATAHSLLVGTGCLSFCVGTW